MSSCFCILTALGQAMVAEAIHIGTDINLTEIAVGDADYVPSENQTALGGEKARINIFEVTRDPDNPNWLRVMAVIPAGIGGWNIHEAGIYAENGNLFAIAKLDGAYKPVFNDGMLKEVSLDFILEVSSEANVNIVVDPNVIIATRKWVIEYTGGKIITLQDLFSRHINDKQNPHEVTAHQAGAYTQTEVDSLVAGLKGLLQNSLSALLPRRSVIMWSGGLAEVPAGWALCDGQKGTPDLRGRFVIGAGGKYGVDDAGGAESHIHNVGVTVDLTTLSANQMPRHTHSLVHGWRNRGSGGDTVCFVQGFESSDVSYAGGSAGHGHSASADIAAGSNLGPYYALAYIMKL